jgi:hypothetical protein
LTSVELMRIKFKILRWMITCKDEAVGVEKKERKLLHSSAKEANELKLGPLAKLTYERSSSPASLWKGNNNFRYQLTM